MDRIERSIVVVNQKGGVGKTEVVKNLANAMNGSMTKRLLIIDVDPNGDQALDWGIGSDDGFNLASALMGSGELEPIELRPGIDLIAGGSVLADMIDELMDPHFGEGGRATREIRLISESALADAVNPLVDERGYQLVLIDTPPGERMIRRLVMTSSLYGILVTKPDYASRAGFAGFVRDAQKFGDDDFNILGAYIGPVPVGASRIKAENKRKLETEVETLYHSLHLARVQENKERSEAGLEPLAEQTMEDVHVFETSIPETRHAVVARELGLPALDYIDKEKFREAVLELDEQSRRYFPFPSGTKLETAKAWAFSHKSLAEEIHARYMELEFGQSEGKQS